MSQSFLRAAVDADRAFCESLHRTNMGGYLAERGIAWDPLRFDANWSAFDKRIIVTEGSNVGLLMLLRIDDVLEIRDLQLLASHSGQGIGTWALAQVNAMATALGLSGLRLRVYANNPARRLYLRLGFVPVAVEGDIIHMRCPVSTAH